jgi:hypothetical protein
MGFSDLNEIERLELLSLPWKILYTLTINIMNKTHWISWTIFWKKWQWIKRRCLNKNEKFYNRYWGRWIKVCGKRLKFEWFKEDMYESYLKHLEVYWNRETTIDRVDNDGNYCKDNCKWSTNKEQANNRSSSVYLSKDWETKTLKQWEDEIWFDTSVILYRLDHWINIMDKHKHNEVLIEYNWDIKSISSWARKYDIEPSKLWDRLRKWIPFEKAIQNKNLKKRMFTRDGRTQWVTERYRELWIKKSTFERRLYKEKRTVAEALYLK